MNLTVICIGKLKEKFFTQAADEYLKRLSRFGKIDIIEIPDEKIPDSASKKEEQIILEKEGCAILSKIKNDSYVVAMCIEGKQLDSVEISEKLNQISISGKKSVFIIGGSLGLSEAVKSRADFKLSFGKITLPHQLMRIVLLEQIYRGFKILSNEKYHK